MTSIHGHKVLDLILSSEPNQTLPQLRQLITDNFGEQAIFHTCSLNDLNVDSLLAFFVERGKVSGSADAFNVDQSTICQHDA